LNVSNTFLSAKEGIDFAQQLRAAMSAPLHAQPIWSQREVTAGKFVERGDPFEWALMRPAYRNPLSPDPMRETERGLAMKKGKSEFK
jgi:hypothetical protein